MFFHPLGLFIPFIELACEECRRDILLYSEEIIHYLKGGRWGDGALIVEEFILKVNIKYSIVIACIT